MTDSVKFANEVPQGAVLADWDDFLENTIGDGNIYDSAFYTNLDSLVSRGSTALGGGNRYITDERTENGKTVTVFMGLEEFLEESQSEVPEETDLKLVLFKTESDALASGREEGKYDFDEMCEFEMEITTDHGETEDVMDELSSELNQAVASGFQYFSSEHTTYLTERFWGIEEFLEQ